jgi:2Fe-2S ferredoxin
MKIVVILPDGTTSEITAKPGASVMSAMRDAGVPVRAECGGAMACATCHVKVAAPWREIVGPAGAEESDLLDLSDYRDEASRLSCQIRMHPGLDGIGVALQLDAFEG